MTEPLQQSFARAVRRHRAELGLSQEAFARRIGVHRTYVGAVERAERKVTFESADRIAARLNVDPRELLDPEYSGPPKSGNLSPA